MAALIALISILPIGLWWIVDSRTPDSGDETLGLLIYGALIFSLFADVIYVWGSDNRQKQAVWAFELGLRFGTAVALIAALFTFLPPPGYQVEPPLLIAIGILALVFIFEVRWCYKLMALIGGQFSKGSSLVDRIGTMLLVIILWRVLLILAFAASYGAAAFVLSRLFPDPLRAQTESVMLLLIVPAVILLISYVLYRLLYDSIARRINKDALRRLFGLGRIVSASLLLATLVIIVATAFHLITSTPSTPNLRARRLLPISSP